MRTRREQRVKTKPRESVWICLGKPRQMILEWKLWLELTGGRVIIQNVQTCSMNVPISTILVLPYQLVIVTAPCSPRPFHGATVPQSSYLGVHYWSCRGPSGLLLCTQPNWFLPEHYLLLNIDYHPSQEDLAVRMEGGRESLRKKAT